MRRTVTSATFTLLCIAGCGWPSPTISSPTSVPLRRVYTNYATQTDVSTISHRFERVTLSAEHRTHDRLGLELVGVQPNGAVTIRQNGNQKSANVCDVFPGNGRSGLTLESSNPSRESATLVARWVE
jgi:hypothetical protein